MKTLYLAIIVISLTSLLFIPWYVKPIQAANTSNVEIQNVQVLPRGVITVGYPIRINATLVNNSPNPILVSHGACDSPFSVAFDNHVLVKNNDIYCTLQLLEQRIDPGKSITATSPSSSLLYLGAYGGTVNASVTFPYETWNPGNQTYSKENATKLFSFTIYNRTKIPTLPQPEKQAVVDAALAVPGLQNWSHDWQFFDMAFMTENNRPDIWRYAVVYLRAPSPSTPLHCNHDSYAMITVDMTTMKVIDSTYPTLETHSCQVSVGGGPGTLGGPTDGETELSSNTTSMESPLKQFKSGMPSKYVKCSNGLQLVIKTEDSSPACVRYTTADVLIERGWAKKTALDVTDFEATVTIPINSSIVSNGFTFTPNTVKTVIGTNNTVRWINLDSAANDVTSDTGSFRSGLIQPGYAWTHTFDKTGTYAYHSVVHPWLKGKVIVAANPLAALANDTGLITMGNRTYYFETPSYTNDAYSHPVQISFHDVVFTLFPNGFRGGLPTSCGIQYYWADAKFLDDSSELLHIFAGPKCSVPPLPTYFSIHTNPQAGLTFYDGKMKLLVSTDVDKSSQQTGSTGTTGTIELQNRTYDFLVLNSTMKGYHNPPLQTVFDGVEFTLLPGPWSGGPASGYSGTPFKAEAKSSDGLYIPLGIFIPDEPSKMNFTTTSLGWHHGLGAGLTISHGNVMILVSKDENDSRITQMNLKAYGFVCCGMKGDLIKGSLSSSAGPIPDANVTISVNDILMGYAKTLPDGCFQFNQWNESKSSNQTSAYLASERSSGSFSPFPLTFTALYHGDFGTHFPASALATSSESLIAIPFPPPQLEATVTPSQVNVTQGSSASVQISVRPMIEQWNVTHMNLYLDRLPCGIFYEISQASDNNTSSTTHPAVFNVTLKAAPYSSEGTYFVGMEQNGTNSMVSRDAAGTFSLNVLKTK